MKKLSNKAITSLNMRLNELQAKEFKRRDAWFAKITKFRNEMQSKCNHTNHTYHYGVDHSDSYYECNCCKLMVVNLGEFKNEIH